MRRLEVVEFLQSILRSESRETCSSAVSMRVKQHAVIEFLIAKKGTPTEIHCRLTDVYRNDVFVESILNRCVTKFRD